MPAISLTSAEQAGVAAADTNLDTAFSSGMNNPDTSSNTPVLLGYNQAVNAGRPPVDRRPFARHVFRAAWVALVRALSSFVEPWTAVPAQGSGPTYAFQNSWVNSGGGFAAAAFRKDPMGVVWLKGRITGGAVPSICFQLPAGYRPTETRSFATLGHQSGGNDDQIHIDIDTSGNVTLSSGAAQSFASLDGVSFHVT